MLACRNIDVVLRKALLHGTRCNVLKHIEFLNRIRAKLARIHTRCNSTTPRHRKALRSLVARLEITLNIGGYRLVVRVVRLLHELLGNHLQCALAIVVAVLLIYRLVVNRLLLIVTAGLSIYHLLGLYLLITRGLYNDAAQSNDSTRNRGRFGIAGYRCRYRTSSISHVALTVI